MHKLYVIQQIVYILDAMVYILPHKDQRALGTQNL